METVLFVCHANICRSPMAERLARLDTLDRLRVVSAGTHAVDGAPMHPGAARALRELGADASGFRSRPLSAGVVAEAALILTATRAQRAICVRLSPSALRRTFTIRQFGRLVAVLDPAPGGGGDPAERLGAVLHSVARARGDLQPVPAADDDLADPVNGTEDDVRACARQIRGALRPALALIAVP